MKFTFTSIMSSPISREASSDLAPVYIKANSILRIILVLLFLTGLVMAFFSGRWASAILVGSLGLVVPLAAMRLMPTTLLTRLLVASSLMTFAALQIHLLSGLVEAHFLIFILLSILLAYRDWRAIVCGAAVIAVHHLIFSHLQYGGVAVYVMPGSHLHGSYLSMVLVHATYVIVQTAGLCILARQMEKDAISAEELGRMSSHIGRREGIFDLSFDDTVMQSQLGDHFKRTMLAVRETLHRVTESIDKVSVTSRDIAQRNEEISTRSQEQEDLVGEAMLTLESVSEMIRNASLQADEANALVDSAGQVAARGKQLVDELAEEMGAVQDSASKISDISSMIDSIAAQTNILALNASVEAARAGDSGLGFAVVASEVRTLAQRTAAASCEIRELINSSQEKIVVSATKTEEVAAAINDETHRVVLIVKQISAAAREQGAGITGVNDAISKVGEVSLDNVRLVGFAANSAEDLRQQAEALGFAIQVFELGSNDEPSEQPATERSEFTVQLNETTSNPYAGLGLAEALPITS